jgi:signal transduction histidine kinase
MRLNSQHAVQFIVEEATAIKHDSVYISGTFNNWDSTANPAYRLKPVGSNQFSITLNLPAGVHRFKITRGTWFSVEKKPNGDEIPDHVFTLKKDTTIKIVVDAWRDQLITDKWLALSREQSDTTRIGLYSALAYIYAFYPEWYNSDSALYCARQALAALQLFKNSKNFDPSSPVYVYPLINNQEVTASLLHSLGNYLKSLELRLDNSRLAESINDKHIMLFAYRNISNNYYSMKDYEKVLSYSKKMNAVLKTIQQKDESYYLFKQMTNMAMAEAFYNLSSLDSALKYATMNYNTDNAWAREINTAFAGKILGDIYNRKGDYKAAYTYYKSALSLASSRSVPHIIALSEKGIATILQKQGKIDSALHYARHALYNLQNNVTEIRSWGENTNSYILEVTPLIASLYKQKNQPDSAYKYLELSVELRDTLYNLEKLRQFQTVSFNETVLEQKQIQQAEEARRKYEERIKIYALIGGLAIVIVIASLLYRNNAQKQKVNLSLKQQKIKIENTLEELKRTQAQLIQSEKMASLGELTAGIAHEIQNPLNFVNNFSEVNTELVEEMADEIDKGNLDGVKTIAKAIKENEEKINHHGKRADAIVKGMLHHSRTSDGQKELTDINALTDEYLRLAYHGLRAKDKSFNVLIETDFDQRVGKTNVVPQDIGRAILNLITNAFYAVNEKKKHEGESYEPTVVVSTKKLKDGVEISIKDNGNGIPQKVKEKIFQPFFTTKPTGQGTGLGLSLSYDIVKAHGGELRLHTKEGEGSDFIIQLPFL